MELKLNKEMSVEEIKSFLNILSKDLKNVQKGKKRGKVSLYDILDANSSYLHYQSQHTYFKEMFDKEKERAWNFRMDKNEEEKAGWNYAGGKKSVLQENEKKQTEWLEKANTKIDIDLWDLQKDFDNCLLILKSMS